MTGSGPAPRLMTEVTKPHAHRARRGSNWDLAGHDGAARRCTKRYRRAVRRLCRCGLDRDHDLGSGRGCYASIIHDPSSSVDAGPRASAPSARIRPRTGRESGARPFGSEVWDREIWGPHRHSGHTPTHGPRAGRAAVGGGSEELRASESVRDSERTYASSGRLVPSTHV